LEIIISRSHIPIAEVERLDRFERTGRPGHLDLEDSRKEQDMREWHKPTIEETESGMEVTSYLPAELDRA
jgi:coenzyme PQQ precursor peptide PqqA